LAAGQLYENYQVADDLLAGRDYFFDHFTAADAHFFWCFRRGTQQTLKVSLAVLVLGKIAEVSRRIEV